MVTIAEFWFKLKFQIFVYFQWIYTNLKAWLNTAISSIKKDRRRFILKFICHLFPIITNLRITSFFRNLFFPYVYNSIFYNYTIRLWPFWQSKSPNIICWPSQILKKHLSIIFSINYWIYNCFSYIYFSWHTSYN